MLSLSQAAEKAVKACMEFKEYESMLIITDRNKVSIGNALFEEAKKISEKVDLIEIPVSEISGQEPPPEVAASMLDHDVIMIPTTKSFTHTSATKNAASKGRRIATLPQIEEEILQRCLDVDLLELKELTDKLKLLLDDAAKVTIKNEVGTDINFSIKGREGLSSTSLVKHERGITNIPSGEAFIAPIEGTSNGTYIVEESQAGIGKLNGQMKFTVEDGIVTGIEGNQATILKQKLDKLNDKNVYNIAEFGIGTNKAARLTGNVLEDEKVFGTCHIAIGSNAGFGGKIQTKSHLDGIILKPTIYFDNKKIMENGDLLV